MTYMYPNLYKLSGSVVRIVYEDMYVRMCTSTCVHVLYNYVYVYMRVYTIYLVYFRFCIYIF